MTRVSLDGLVKRYGPVRALDGISLEIVDGAFVSLLGPSGCGKTTTLKLIAGFEAADQGSICFDGGDVSRVPAERRNIGMVFQNYALFPHMTVAGNLAFGLEVRRVAKPEIAKRVRSVLETVQLAEHAERYPRQLSGGQQQRVALARALVIEPRILLLDEPLANLDAKLREEMRVFIRDLQRRVGITTVYVTHDQAEAMTMSDLVVVMLHGRISQAGPPAEIYERPASLEVARFVGQANLIEARVISRANGGWTLATPLGLMTLPGDRQLAEGQRAMVVVRPESIAMARPEAGGAGWSGRIAARYYSGSVVDYRVMLDCGTELHAQAGSGMGFSEGDPVRVTVPDDRIWAIAAA
ncbi:MAG: ABC transporter ATP-binding protein [Proteobacteria bacterium]|nr:ABC transporter ATP-binding protein [Pseudomonadota bacterium]MBI3498673.1 ABC transporter ATP-binding protein [Pseudomonadota bacterium]